MSKKTSAEIQIEYLKQLKKGNLNTSSKIKIKTNLKTRPVQISPQAGKSVRTPPSRRDSSFELNEILRKPVEKTPGRELLPRVKVSSRRLKELHIRRQASGSLLKASDLWDWALELLQEIPWATASLSVEARKDFFNTIRQWLKQRGIDHD